MRRALQIGLFLGVGLAMEVALLLPSGVAMGALPIAAATSTPTPTPTATGKVPKPALTIVGSQYKAGKALPPTPTPTPTPVLRR